MSTGIEKARSELEQLSGLATDGSQYLTFTLGDEHYGVDILRVQEIKGYTAVMRIPNTPAFVKGVLNLRGTIVPIVDLQTKFGMDQVEYTMFTCIVLVVVHKRLMGIVVDAVSDVLSINPEDIQPAPNFGTQVDTGFIQSIARTGEKLITLLDIERVLSSDEFQHTTAVASSPEGQKDEAL